MARARYWAWAGGTRAFCSPSRSWMGMMISASRKRQARAVQAVEIENWRAARIALLVVGEAAAVAQAEHLGIGDTNVGERHDEHGEQDGDLHARGPPCCHLCRCSPTSWNHLPWLSQAVPSRNPAISSVPPSTPE